jgi:hypothetical protein
MENKNFFEEYHKINSVYKRDPKTKKIIIGDYSTPEIEFLKNNQWTADEKIDGTNIRIGWDCEKVIIGGRTKDAQLSMELIQSLQKIFTVEKFKSIYPETPMTLYGQAFGIQGKTFGIPTVDASVKRSIPLYKIEYYVERFIDYAKEHPELTFLVTEIGCGLAGFKVKDIAPLFVKAIDVENIHLPSKFWHKLENI